MPGTVDAALVSRLNDSGVVVTARHRIDSATGADRTWLGSIMGDNPNDLSTGVLIAGLGLLEVVLLVGPAFAVGVRRRRRDLALVAVAGGDAAQLRRVVLADGVVLGVLGAAAGLLVGVGAAFAGRPLMEQYVFSARFGGYRCWPSALVLLGGVAVLAGVLAALAPAWTAARQDVSAGLAGRRTPAKSPGRWLALGLALVVGGAGLAAFGATRTSPAVILTGLILGELGLVCCTPTLLGLLARLGRVLPLAPRIALRDASRNRAAAAPAICAVMAAVASSVALGGYLASDGARDARAYRPALPTGHVLVNPVGSAGQPTLAQVTAAARDQLGAGAVAPVQTPSCGAGRTGYCDIAPVLPLTRACPWQPGVQLPPAQRQQARADPRCQFREADFFGGYVKPGVDDGTALPLLTGVDPATTAAATTVLRAGGVVVTDPRYLHDGLVTVRVSEVEAGPDRPVTVHDLPGYALPRATGQPRLLLSAAAARATRPELVADRLGDRHHDPARRGATGTVRRRPAAIRDARAERGERRRPTRRLTVAPAARGGGRADHRGGGRDRHGARRRRGTRRADHPRGRRRGPSGTPAAGDLPGRGHRRSRFGARHRGRPRHRRDRAGLGEPAVRQ